MSNHPRLSPTTGPRGSRAALVLVALALIAVGLIAIVVPAGAQIVTRRPQPLGDDSDPATTYVGGGLTYAAPQRDFKNYVDGAFGLTGHLVHAFDRDGIIALRVDGGYLIYGSTTNRQALGGGALGLINVDVTTSNNIVFGGVGLQLMAPTEAVRPYLSGTVGFSYFFTESTIEGTSSSQPFANSQNFDDGGFTTIWGGGLYIPIRHGGKNPVALDIGAQVHANNDVQYLTKSSISFTSSTAPPVITPVRSAADFVTFRIGVTIGIR